MSNVLWKYLSYLEWKKKLQNFCKVATLSEYKYNITYSKPSLVTMWYQFLTFCNVNIWEIIEVF